MPHTIKATRRTGKSDYRHCRIHVTNRTKHHMKRFPSFVLIAAALNLSTWSNLSAQWLKQSPYPTNLDLYTVAFTSRTHGVVGGQTSQWDTSGGLWQTLDGGSTWTQRDVPMSSSDPINTIFFLDSQLGWAMGNGTSPNCS